MATTLDFTLPALSVMRELSPNASTREAQRISEHYFKKVAAIIETAESHDKIQGVNIVSAEIIELRYAQLLVRQLEEYREMTTATLIGLDTGDAVASINVVIALNDIVGKLTGLRTFVMFHLTDSVSELERNRMDARLEFFQEETARRFSKRLWQLGSKDLGFSVAKRGFYLEEAGMFLKD